MNKILVIGLKKKFGKFEKIKISASKILKNLKQDGVQAEIYLLGDRDMKFLNKKFRGKDKAADVLSFNEPKNFVSPPSKFRRIGEVYLNMSDVRCQMLNVRCQMSDVRNRLLIHGLLHLLGYVHKKKNDRIKMEKIEQKLLGQI